MKGIESLFSSTVKEKEVFFFATEKIFTEDPHFFICVKKTESEVLLFTCCTSQGGKREDYLNRKGVSLKTLVYIKPVKGLPFTKDTFVDCNKCFQYTMEEFKKMCEEGTMQYKGEISPEYYEQIIVGLLESPEIDQEVKNKLPDPSDIE
ncbi:hypothetical protein [Flavitalea sp.]|nr:hypothetical protein [Flavitalea sp.]